MNIREQEELQARHAIMRDTVSAQAEQLAQAQARIRELEGELALVRVLLGKVKFIFSNSTVTPEERLALMRYMGKPEPGEAREVSM